MKFLKQVLTHRALVAVISVMIQLGLIMYLIYGLSVQFRWIYIGLQIVSILTVLALTTQQATNPKYIQTWTIIILGIPVIGVAFYLLLGNRKMPSELLEKSKLRDASVGIGSTQDSSTLTEFLTQHRKWTKLMSYLENTGHFPVFDSTSTYYYPTGESAFKDMKEKLLNANKYIFMEYFIIKFGTMWDEILEILIKKAKQGIDVRLIYDDWGCPDFNAQYVGKLRGQGIKVYPFNKLTYKFVVQMNNRSHRKILIVDGDYGYVSGLNIADEYVNRIKRFGYWKDNAVRIQGSAVISLIDMFLTFWSFCSNDPKENINLYNRAIQPCQDDGYIQPFSDNPSDDLTITETLHILAINGARKSIKIVTPYLILGHEMTRALSNMSMSGIDVKIIVPGIPDKKLVYMVTRSNYEALIDAGIQIYEYSPGFIHQKMIIVDNDLSIISTANMDFRSYYLNFECGICFYNSRATQQSLHDFNESLNLSDEVTPAEVKSLPFTVKFARAVVGLFSGLM